MPLYAYEAVNTKGKKVSGVLRGQSKQVVINELRTKGLSLRSVKEKEKSMLDMEITFGPPVKLEHFVFFCRQFATLIRSGVMIEPAIKMLEQQAPSKKMREALGDVLEQLRNGMSISSSMARHPAIFPPMFTNMLAAGEITGELDHVLTRLAVHYEKENKTIKKVQSAMTYPIIVITIALVVVGYLLTNVVPVFAGMFKQQKLELPLVTKVVLGISSGLQEVWWVIILVAIAIWITFVRIKKDPAVAMILDTLILKIPLFGELYLKASIARLTRTLSALFKSAVPVLQALEITEKVIGNRLIEKVLRESREGLQQGRPLSEAFSTSKVFPQVMTQMVVIGEETGQIEEMLSKIADSYEEDVEQNVERLKSLIEPLMLVIIAGLVGIIVMAIMSPMFKLYENFL